MIYSNQHSIQEEFVESKLNILLVDDDYTLAYSTAKLIHRIGGHVVYVVDEPAEIFWQCENKNIDLILMDVNLPHAQWQGMAVSGADLARVLKNYPPTVDIPIILVTAYAMLAERKVLLENSQADELMTKPITDYGALLDLIHQLCL